MGRLVREDQNVKGLTFISPTQEIINKNEQSLIEKTASPFVVHLESRPTFVTYYNRIMFKSTEDKGLENVEKRIGHHSPIKFAKINNFPLYGIEQLSVNLENELGLEIRDYGDAATILPGTIRPLEGDYFSISYIGRQYLFQINSVVFDQIKSKPFYRVEYTLERKIEERDFEDQIEKEYEFIFSNVGTKASPLIELRTSVALGALYDVYEALLDRYIEYFYVKRFNCFMATLCGNMPTYNSYLMTFFKNNKLISYRREFLKSFYIQDNFFPKTNDFYNMYRRSPFHMFDMRDGKLALNVDLYKLGFVPIFLEENPFATYGEQVNQTVLAGDSGSQCMMSREVLDHIYSDTLFSKAKRANIIPNLYVDHLNGRDAFKDDKVLAFLNNFSWYNDEFTYFNVPFILKVMRDTINSYQTVTQL